MAKLVSKTYGDALFEVAKSENRLDEFYEQTQVLLEVLRTNEELTKLMDQPKIIKEDKIKIIEETFGGKVAKEIVGVMTLLINKGHYTQMESVFEYFIDIVKEEKRIGVAYVTTPLEVNKETQSEIEKKLLETTSYKTFEMHWSVDASLIGGMIIRIGDRVVDSSIKTRLFELSRDLKNIQIG